MFVNRAYVGDLIELSNRKYRANPRGWLRLERREILYADIRLERLYIADKALRSMKLIHKPTEISIEGTGPSKRKLREFLLDELEKRV
jgi:hypothetical protein